MLHTFIIIILFEINGFKLEVRRAGILKWQVVKFFAVLENESAFVWEGGGGLESFKYQVMYQTATQTKSLPNKYV